MKRHLRSWGIGFAAVLGTGLVLTPPVVPAQARQIVDLLQEPSPLMGRNVSQGYLGVDLADVDQEKAQALKLKEVRGAVITLIDHDAPAGQVGLRVNDVVVMLNGQTVEGAEQLRRMLKEIPAGRKVSLEISRDGNLQTLNVELADRQAMEHEIWNKIGNNGDVFAQPQGMGILSSGDAPLPGGFHMPIFGSSLNVGAMVEPLTSQMAEYLGVPSGLMIKQVARKSEAASAGLKAFDVILKVGADPITTLADWDRSLRSNQGKPVQVTILRDKKQQTLTLQVDSKRHGELLYEEILPSDECPLVAELAPEFAQNAAEAAEALRNQVGELRIDPQQAEELSRQAERLSESFRAEDFNLDQKQIDQMRQQMEEFRKNFKLKDFKIDPQMMEQFHQRMDEFKRQMEEWNAERFGAQV